MTFVGRTGIPDSILTGHGAVFTGKVFSRIAEILGCRAIKTTPYHPQGNGVVERLHGTLKPMLAKTVSEGINWAKFLPMALFALRQVPNVDSVFSVFQF